VLIEQIPVTGVRVGDVLHGKYRIDRVLGMGGAGVVVAGHHLQLAQNVAIKFLLPEALPSSEALIRFTREARAAVRIKSEHVARVLDMGTLETGTRYIVMEYLVGNDLSHWIEKNGSLPVDQAVTFVLQACEAIAEAHALGIVHRDIKPANLFVIRRPDGQLSVKVLDFGISKIPATIASTTDLSMTKTNAAIGTPLYMSPEQMSSARRVDSRADIWSLGVVLYELVSGQVPFEGPTIANIFVGVTTRPAPSLRVSRPDIPRGFETVVAKCLERDPALRYQSVAELAMALVSYAPARAQESVHRICGTMQAAGLSVNNGVPISDPAGGTPGVTTRRRPRWSLAFGAIALALIATGIARRSGMHATTAVSPVPSVVAEMAPHPGSTAPPWFPTMSQPSTATPVSTPLHRAIRVRRASPASRSLKPSRDVFEDRR
jgi:serine/threonine-protein kinase